MFRKPPEAIAIVLVILLIFLGLTWIIPGGEFARADYSEATAMLRIPLSPEESTMANRKGSFNLNFETAEGPLQLLVKYSPQNQWYLAEDSTQIEVLESSVRIPAAALGEFKSVDSSDAELILSNNSNIVFREGKELVVAGSYKQIPSQPQNITAFLLAPIRGFTDHHAALIIAFVLLVGGAFSMMNATGAIHAGLQQLLGFAMRRKSFKIWIIPILIGIFSFAGCTFGMSEEVLVFVLITLPLSDALGYDKYVGVAIPFIGAAVGFAGAAINPFNVGIAQGIAQLPPGSGVGYRWIVWLLYTIVAILFVMWYAKRIEKKNGSVNADFNAGQMGDHIAFNARRKLIIVLFLSSLVVLMYGAQNWSWYIEEISALFVALGLLTVIVGRMNVKDSVDAFLQGAKDMLPAAIIIGLSKSLLLIAGDGKIIDTVLNSTAGLLHGLPTVVSAELMFIVHGFINFFIPSGSGQAAITMPIMTPLADLLDVSRQTAVLAFQFGDGLFNLIIPTSGVTMGVLSIAGIPFSDWIKWIWKFFLIMMLLSMVLIAVSVFFDVW